MTVSSADIDRFIRGKSPGGNVRGKYPDRPTIELFNASGFCNANSKLRCACYVEKCKLTEIKRCWSLNLYNWRNNKFIHSGNFYSASSSLILLRGAPDTARILCQSCTRSATGNCERRTCPGSLYAWQLEWGSNERRRIYQWTIPPPINWTHERRTWLRLQERWTTDSVSPSVRMHPLQQKAKQALKSVA